MNAEYVSVTLFVAKEVDFLRWKQTQSRPNIWKRSACGPGRVMWTWILNTEIGRGNCWPPKFAECIVYVTFVLTSSYFVELESLDIEDLFVLSHGNNSPAVRPALSGWEFLRVFSLILMECIWKMAFNLSFSASRSSKSFSLCFGLASVVAVATTSGRKCFSLLTKTKTIKNTGEDTDYKTAQ